MDSTFYDKLKSSSYVITPMEIIEQYPDLSKDAKFCYLYLLKYASISIANGHVENGIPLVFLSRGQVGERMGVNRNTATRYLSELVEVGLIKITRRGQGQVDVIEVYTPKDIASTSGCSIPRASSCTENRAQIYNIPNIQKTPSDVAAEPPPKPTLDEVKQAVKVIEERKATKKQVSEKTVKVEKAEKLGTNKILKDFSMAVQNLLAAPAPLISGKERSLVKKLVEHYGEELTYKIFMWTVDNWFEFKRRKKLDGNPTVGLIWGYRECIIPNCTTNSEAEGDALDW